MKNIKKIYIITNKQKDPEYIYTNKICDYLDKIGIDFYNERHIDKEPNASYSPVLIPDDIDIVLVLGGDGTMLRASGYFCDTGIPLLGINLGTLGYMAETDSSDWKEAIDLLAGGNYFIEERMMIEGRVIKRDFHETARVSVLNDVVLTYAAGNRIIDFDVYVNGSFLTTFKADGMIVSTPTGSTGYSLSAGGPIVKPDAGLILLTPICPHTLNARSILLSEDDQVHLAIKGNSVAEVALDGMVIGPLDSSYIVEAVKSEATTKIIKLKEQSFLETVRKKMN